MFEETQEESLFSIQFAAPYTIAIPARLIGISAPIAMWLSGAIAAFLMGTVLSWLLNMIFKDRIFAMFGAIFVISTGAFAAGEGAVGEILDIGFPYPYFPGFRRYVPALALLAFFVFFRYSCFYLVDDKRRRIEKKTAFLCFSIFWFCLLCFFLFLYLDNGNSLVCVLDVFMVITTSRELAKRSPCND